MIVFGMAALGVLVGVFAAWSATPIVTTLLPLLFGIVGGVSGVSIAKMDVSASDGQLKIKLLGQMLASFSVACTLAVVLCVYLRPKVQDIDQVTLVYGKGSADYVDALVLRRKLEALGASPAEIGYVFKLLSAEAKPDLAAIDTKVDEVLGRSNKSASGTAEQSPQPATDKSAANNDPEKQDRKSKFPLAYQPLKADPFGLWSPDSGKLLYGYGGGAAANPGLQPESPFLEQFRPPRNG